MKLREGVWCHNKNDARSGYAGDATNSQTWLVAATARGRGIPGRWAPAGNCSTKLKVLTKHDLIYLKFYSKSHNSFSEIRIYEIDSFPVTSTFFPWSGSPWKSWLRDSQVWIHWARQAAWPKWCPAPGPSDPGDPAKGPSNSHLIGIIPTQWLMIINYPY